MKNSSKSWRGRWRRNDSFIVHRRIFRHVFIIIGIVPWKNEMKNSLILFSARHIGWNFNNCSLSSFTASQSVCHSPRSQPHNIKTFSSRLSSSSSSSSSLLSFRFLCHAQLVCCGWCIFDIKFYFIFRSSFFHSFYRLLIRLSFFSRLDFTLIHKSIKKSQASIRSY